MLPGLHFQKLSPLSRGGRRRRSKRSNRPEGASGATHAEAGPAGSARNGSRSRTRESVGQRSAIDSMSSLPSSVQTLPPDGVVLEELISNMQTEYGTPTTPQEYRLIVKVPVHEEAAAPAEAGAIEAAEDSDEPDDEGRLPRANRRRRRGRRRGSAAAIDAGGEFDGPYDNGAGASEA